MNSARAGDDMLVPATSKEVGILVVILLIPGEVLNQKREKSAGRKTGVGGARGLEPEKMTYYLPLR